VTTAAEADGPAGVGASLRLAARDFYEESWRLVALNSLLSAYALGVLAVAIYVPLAFVLLVGLGPLTAMLVFAAVTIVDTGSLTIAEATEGLRRCWRRGLVLAAAAGFAVLATVVALRFYVSASALSWPLAMLVLYLAGIFAVHQVMLWPLALRDAARPLRDLAADAGILLVRRPLASVGLALALLAVNLAGLALAVLPLLTMTIAYSALAAARFTAREA
jgi:hypothetical protein